MQIDDQHTSVYDFVTDGTPADVVERYASLKTQALHADYGDLDRNIVVIDTETTGVSERKDELTQIAAARLERGEITEWFVTFVNPGKPIPDEISHLTNIFDTDVADAPTPVEACEQLARFVGDATLVAHNAAFDRHFVTKNAGGACLKENLWIDSLDLARIALPRLKSHRLIDLVHAFDAPISTHRADADVEALCAVYRILLAAVSDMPNDLVEYISKLAPIEEWSTGAVFALIAAQQREHATSALDAKVETFPFSLSAMRRGRFSQANQPKPASENAFVNEQSEDLPMEFPAAEEWGHPELLDRSLSWYLKAEKNARKIAERQGFKGVRWMKMTDPDAGEAPSSTGSFLIWQQPHLIYLAEMLYRANPSPAVLQKYGRLVEETAQFMGDFVTYDQANDRYTLRGCIAAQETLPAATTVNPPFELSYWHFALEVAQQWRERLGKQRDAHWEDIIRKISPLADKDSLYLAAETEPDTYRKERMFSDHPAVMGAVGVLPLNVAQVDLAKMKKTEQWIWKNWKWATSWGWDYPMMAMCAARMGEPQNAVGALLMKQQKNTYLVSGHNYQDARLRLYLPGNGGLLMAVGMMCAGWDGSTHPNPGFPQDGNWNVRWEGLKPLP